MYCPVVGVNKAINKNMIDIINAVFDNFLLFLSIGKYFDVKKSAPNVTPTTKQKATIASSFIIIYCSIMIIPQLL